MRLVSFDSLGMGVSFQCYEGGPWYKKVAPLVSERVEGGELLWDARLEFPNAEPAMVLVDPSRLKEVGDEQ